MKIGLVLPEVPQYSETFFNFKINGLVESGFEVLLFTGNKKNSKNRANEKVKVIPAYPVYRSSSIYQFLLFIYVVSFRFIFSLKKTLKLISLESKVGKNFSERMKSVYLNAHILKENIDVLHFGFTTMAIQRENVAKAMNAKMSVSFRGYDINIYPLKNPDCYKNVWRNIDKVHTISNYLREKAVSLGLPEKTPYIKITPAIDFEKLSQNKMRTDISVPKILTVGRLNWIKNYETAISALKLLSDDGIDFSYNIIGDGPELERLKFAVYQYGLENKINFCGKKSHDEVLEIMGNSDIYLQPSYEEGFCVSVLEAQAAGLMCIVSDAEGLKENVVDGESGWIIPKRNFKSFNEKIAEVCKMSFVDRKKISDTARERVKKEFRLEDQNEKFKEFFQNMINQNG
ncbi:MAG TPA: glycosyltransferase family 4 protein [Ignavibacteria bacterium]|nr:glycosyltransferase family 4 protein [Ignavibacteria bacterium]